MKQLVPFISSPLKWIGLHPSSFYETLLVFSGIGAYIWSSAEFSYNRYIALYFFPTKQLRPGQFVQLDKIDWEKAGKPEMPVTFFSFKNFKKLTFRFLYKVFLAYSLLGLLSVVFGIVSGVKSFTMYIYEALLFIISQIVFAVQHLIAPIERWGDDNYWGTIFFLSVYNYRQELDNKLEHRLQRAVVIPAKEIGTIYPLLNGIKLEAGRITALTIFVILILLTIHKA